MGLMATDTSPQYTPTEGGWELQSYPLPAFSYKQHIRDIVLAHVSKCEARAIIVVPKTRAAWFPMMEGAGVRSVQTTSQGASSQFF